MSTFIPLSANPKPALAPPFSSYECFPSLSTSFSSPPPPNSAPPPYLSFSSNILAQGYNDGSSCINKQNLLGASIYSQVYEKLIRKLPKLPMDYIEELEAMVSTVQAKLHMPKEVRLEKWSSFS
ncbi:hypothetical protein Nepgr_027774 [Nepenthes gracilis]|uniref:Uncharacterized protein n=1 Tax=Nepenthes gracilis TaxID=150966 RepID=A0AAD3TB50_NEPGR|nr:hypothetical protein Nepgr_027774 [Nepenthes gracilis]